MKKIYLSVTIEVPDDETGKNWAGILKEMESLLILKGYSVYDADWGEI